MLYWYINLDRRQDRDKGMRDCLKSKKFPNKIIQRHKAMDRESYTSPTALASDALGDNFPCFMEVSEEGSFGVYGIQYWGMIWTYMRVLREIADQNEIVIFSHDDWGPRLTYEAYLALILEIKDFEIAQVAWNWGDPIYKRPTYPYSDHWARHIESIGQDFTIYTPSGAAWMLEQCQKHFPDTPETVIFNCSYRLVYAYHFLKPDMAVQPIPGSEINDCNIQEPCYQGNYFVNGQRVEDVCVEDVCVEEKPAKVVSNRKRHTRDPWG